MATPEIKRHTYYWAIPIVLYLVTQTTLAVWWASSIDSELNQLNKNFIEYEEQNNAEQLRQWSRIDDNKDSVGAITGQIALTNQELQFLRQDITETNDLLRSIVENNTIIPRQ